ncbi:FG-GAP repeat domain-containing protein [Catellatospora sichuanensis]|uniref:FG-GAP repeat domain-containing protein n=1 Tax=Catellatospora sichuanensis TaxID=1969805 RepID=UPI001181E60B|nr:VCBS repeat-containing protein [Catellatospora sichuanensis]
MLDTERYGVLVADFNGDGKDDLAYHGLCGTPSVPCWRVLASTGTGFAAARNWSTDSTVTSADTFTYGFHVGDFDDDGRADIAFRASCGTDRHACWTVLASQPGDSFAVRGFGDGMWADPALTPTYGVLAADFDGDRRTDLAYPGLCGTGVSCLRVQSSTGTSFVSLNWITSPFYFDDAPVNVSAHFGMRAADRNGDGLADVATWGKCGAPGVPQWRYLLSTTGGATVSCSTTGP